MRKFLTPALTGLALLISPSLIAEILPDDLGPQHIQEPLTEESQGDLFKLEFEGDYIWKAKIKNTFGEENLRFATANVEANAIYYYNPCYSEAATAALIYQWTRLDWNRNPYFTQQDINTLTLALGGITQRFTNWTWRGEFDINFDDIAHWNPQDYMNYDLLAWGRYAYCENFGVHIGFLAQTGMKIDRVYPVIGIDWQYNCKWNISLVFPVDIAITYSITPALTTGLEMRFFDQRHRIGKKEFLEEGLWHYQTTGLEFAMDYNPTKWLSANIHVGADLGGHLTIANRQYRHHDRLKLKAAPYAGGELTFSF